MGRTRGNRRCSGVVAMVVLVAAVAAGAGPAGAASFSPSSAVADGTSGSLRDAIDQANAAGEASVITLDGGTYTLDDCSGPGGDLEAVGSFDLTIEGNGSTIVQTCADERVIRKSGAWLRIRDAVITGGELSLLGTHVAGGQIVAFNAELVDVSFPASAISANGTDFAMGAVAFVEGDLVLDGVTVADVTVIGPNIQGGAFFAGTELTATDLTVTGVTVLVPDGGELEGAVLWGSIVSVDGATIDDTVVTGTLDASVIGGLISAGTQSTIDGLQAADTSITLGAGGEVIGGVIASHDDVTVADTTIMRTDVTAGADGQITGGTVAVDGDASLADVFVYDTDVQVGGGEPEVRGGAISVEGFAALARVSVVTTHVGGDGDGRVLGGSVYGSTGVAGTSVQLLDTQVPWSGSTQIFGGALFTNESVEVRDLTIARTEATTGADGHIQGVGANANGAVALTNATISTNLGRAGGGSPAPILRGGGLFVIGGLELNFVTMTGNGFVDGPGEGAHLYTGGAELFATVLADAIGADGCVSAVASSTWSYAEDTSCGLVGVGDTEGGASPLLGTLADNGGLTFTHLPAGSSPLLDRIAPSDDARCGTVDRDQRGAARPQNERCDIGAVEVGPLAATPPGSPLPGDPGGAAEAVTGAPRFTG